MPDTNIKDQLGTEADIFPFGVWDIKETVNVEEIPTVIESYGVDPDLSFVLGMSLLGNGHLGDSGVAQTVVIRVVNSDQTHREHFRDTEFKSVATTANWDTTNFRVGGSKTYAKNLIIEYEVG